MSISQSIFGVIAAGGVILAAAGVTSTSTPQYDIIDLGTFGGSVSLAKGINELGQVVGGADIPDGNRHAFLWDNGVMTDLGTISPWTQSEAWDVNKLGDVTGIVTTGGSVTHGFIWQNQETGMVDLGHLSGLPTGNTGPWAINDAVQIVGISTTVDSNNAFLWEDGVMTDLTETYGVSPGAGRDINASGEVIIGPDLLHEDGTATRLPTLGGDFVQGFALNDVGQVVGWSERAGSETNHAFLWEEEAMTDLGAIGGFGSSRAWAINNFGQVVGDPGFLYGPYKGMLDLHDLIPPDSGWTWLSPHDINDTGQIAGDGYIDGWHHAFLMTPIPVPAVSMWGMIIMTLALATGGTIVIARRRARA